jgi:hypothetical protein
MHPPMSSYETRDTHAAHEDRTRGPTGLEIIVGCVAQAQTPPASMGAGK